MDLQKILNTIALLGSNLPAFKALFDQVVNAFDGDDQDVLKATYADMMSKSDAAHRAAQEL